MPNSGGARSKDEVYIQAANFVLQKFLKQADVLKREAFILKNEIQDLEIDKLKNINIDLNDSK